jgi:hypothetical protein
MKPWMRPRRGETQSERIERLNRTCFYCGRRQRSVEVCDRHEDRCAKNPHRKED